MQLGVRVLLCGIFEGYKWIEICQRHQDGAWIMSNGQGVLGVRFWQPLPDMPEM
jgi:hypothetical protein